MACFNAILALFWWSGTESAILPRNAYIQNVERKRLLTNKYIPREATFQNKEKN